MASQIDDFGIVEFGYLVHIGVQPAAIEIIARRGENRFAGEIGRLFFFAQIAQARRPVDGETAKTASRRLFALDIESAQAAQSDLKTLVAGFGKRDDFARAAGFGERRVFALFFHRLDDADQAHRSRQRGARHRQITRLENIERQIAMRQQQNARQRKSRNHARQALGVDNRRRHF